MLLNSNPQTAAQIVDVTAAQCSRDVTMSDDVTNAATNAAPMDDAAAATDTGKKISTDERIAGAGEKGIMNKFGTNGITPETSTQARIDDAAKFFGLIHGKLPAGQFVYLINFSGGTKCSTFDSADESQLRAMAQKAIELSDSGGTVYHSVNSVAVKPHYEFDEKQKKNVFKRGDENVVSYQTAVVVDIDIRSTAHKGNPNKFPPDFATAKSFLPFAPTILVNSGYGLHAYYCFDEPLEVTADNREEIKRRNKSMLDVVRQRAGQFAGAVDGVDDLPRILRTVGTFNYKCGKDNPPLCHVVEDNNIRYTPADLDEKLNALLPTPAKETSTRQQSPETVTPKKSARQTQSRNTTADTPEYDAFRVKKILDLIASKNNENDTHTLSWNQYIAVLTACKQLGLPYDGIVDEFCKRDPTGKYNYSENRRRYDGLKNTDKYGMQTLVGIAKHYGYDEKSMRHEYNSRSRADTADVYTDPEAEVKQDEAQKSRDKKIAEIKELESQPQSLERDEKIRALIRDCCEWKTDRKKRRTSIKDTSANTDLIFTRDPDIDGLFAQNDFRNARVFLKPAPWRQTSFGDEWTDADDDQLQYFLRKNYAEIANEKLYRQTFTHFAELRRFHEVQQYFRSLPKWDNVPRAETLFIDWLGVDDNAFTREVTWKFLLGAIARIFHAGCRFQWALVIHGKQHVGKSFIFERLGGKWHITLSSALDNPHAIDDIQNGWIVELKEFACGRKSELNSVKSFIERAADDYRAPYARTSNKVNRHVVFAITINDDQFLSDLTGNRRFLILHSNLPKFGYVEDVRGERLTDDNVIAQIWAEVYQKFCEMFAGGFDEKLLELSRDAQIFGEQIAEGYLRDNSLKAEIAAALDQKILPPVIWNLLSKPERRQFFQNGGSIAIEETDLEIRFKTRRKKIPDELQAEFDAARTGEFVKRVDARDPRTGVFTTHFIFYATEYRQHVCVAEILNEFFSPAEKKSPNKIHEILATIEGWALGERIPRDSCYGNQPKVYYRDATNIPTDVDQPQPQPETQEPNQSINTDLAPPDTKSATPTDTSFDDLCSRGEPLAADEVPPDDDDLPF